MTSLAYGCRQKHFFSCIKIFRIDFIAFDIIKAFKVGGVMVLTVTYLLSFAQRIYDEASEGQGVEFFSAQRLPDGSRTFKMIQHEPELTSFGLDLYERIVAVKE